MGLFSRSSATASSSSATLDKDIGPATSEIYLTPREGINVTKKWTYDDEQLKKVGLASWGPGEAGVGAGVGWSPAARLKPQPKAWHDLAR